VLAGALWLQPAPSPETGWYTLSGAAWADDDGGDDDDAGGGDDDDDGDDDVGASTGGDDDATADTRPSEQGTRPATNRPRVTKPRRLPLPVAAPEVVVTDLSETELAQLLSDGFSVLETRTLPGGVGTVNRLASPHDLPLEAARDQVRQLLGGREADFNHFYRTSQVETVTPAATSSSRATICAHENCEVLGLAEWPLDRAARPSCQVAIPVGVIDTGVNAAHDILEGARIEVVRLSDDRLDPSRAIHGTAVASLLVGKQGSRVPGLIPEAGLIVADIFSRDGQDERADVVAVLRGLDLMAKRGVRVVNLSLAGPANTVLQDAIERLSREKGMIVVAAAGNAGPSAPPAFPAAYDPVIAVTAVDARGRVFGAAQRGPHLDIAAPGVGLMLATSIRGARPQSGTSFAVPFVTATVSILMSQELALPPPADGSTVAPEDQATRVTQRLVSLARDMGAPGTDDIFGQGLLSAAEMCP
jgi:hypothetical protein